MRDRTVLSEVCLIQLAGERRHAAVDPLAKDLERFAKATGTRLRIRFEPARTP